MNIGRILPGIDTSKYIDVWYFMPHVGGVNAVSLFHALSDETRLAVLEELKEGERCVCELTEAMKAGQSRLSFHLKVLKDAGLILDRREGRWMYYAINPEAIESLEELVKTLKRAAKSGRAGSRCC